MLIFILVVIVVVAMYVVQLRKQRHEESLKLMQLYEQQAMRMKAEQDANDPNVIQQKLIDLETKAESEMAEQDFVNTETMEQMHSTEKRLTELSTQAMFNPQY